MSPTEPPVTEKGTLDMNRKIMIGLAAALVVVALGMYFWKASAVSRVEEQLAAVRNDEAQARAALVEQARQLDARRNAEALRLFSTPLAWAIRRELMASNLDQVDQYLSELVQMPGFQSAVLADPDGKVVVATDRKHLGQPFSSIYPAQYAQAREVGVESVAGGGMRAVVPILGLSQQLGTLVVEYAAPAYALK